MSGPLIPYIEAPEIPLAFLEYIPLLGEYVNPQDPPSIKPFGTLVAIGVYVGSWITMERARERGLDEKKLSDFIFWVVAFGFVISHVFDALTYHPETVAEDPWYLLRIWDGLSSFGGFLGAVVGAFAWKFHKREKIMEFVDVTVSAFPAAWVFGRSGCAVVHDHPGRMSNAWFAVKYPPHTLAEGFDGRFDLGLIEMVLTIPLALACWWLWRRKVFRPNGFYVAVTLVAYAPVRFLLDFLRVDPNESLVTGGAVDHRYAGLTPAQWACFVALAVGFLFLYRIRGAEYVPNAPRAPEEDLEDAEEDEDDENDEDDEDEAPRRRARRKKKKASGKASAKPTKKKKRSPAGGDDGAASKKRRAKKRAEKKPSRKVSADHADEAGDDEAEADV